MQTIEVPYRARRNKRFLPLSNGSLALLGVYFVLRRVQSDCSADKFSPEPNQKLAREWGLYAMHAFFL